MVPRVSLIYYEIEGGGECDSPNLTQTGEKLLVGRSCQFNKMNVFCISAASCSGTQFCLLTKPRQSSSGIPALCIIIFFLVFLNSFCNMRNTI